MALTFIVKPLAKMVNSHGCFHCDEVTSQVGAKYLVPFCSAPWKGEPIPHHAKSLQDSNITS